MNRRNFIKNVSIAVGTAALSLQMIRMPRQMNTCKSFGKREDLTNIISRIDPNSTPIFNRLHLMKGNRAAMTEWQVEYFEYYG